MFSDIAKVSRTARRDSRISAQIKGAERDHVLWCQDRISLAVYHKRPKAEIVQLLKVLKEATGHEEARIA